jgi:hypothetical protein
MVAPSGENIRAKEEKKENNGVALSLPISRTQMLRVEEEWC